MQFPEEASAEVITRLRRAEGQIRGVQRLIDEGADCKDIVQQLTAAQAALTLSFALLGSLLIARHALGSP